MAMAALGSDQEKIPFSNKRYCDEFHKILKLKDEGHYEIDLSYFSFPFDRSGWVSDKFLKVFGPRRKKDEKFFFSSFSDLQPL